ncbi:MAG TPA: thioredoxin domain-containing protein [Candidatus Saccharibacteria bacterium]|nr:thioredoxin domain-containing protein [Candidatus Saccharibacteria bacterium]
MKNNFVYVFMAIIVGGVFLYVLNISSSNSLEADQMNNRDLTKFTQGNLDAPVKVTQYSDFLCPSCSQVSLGIVPKIIEKYVTTGNVYYTFVPMAFIAPGSQLAAEGAFCAAKQDKFWEYHDVAYQAVWEDYFSKGVDPSRVPLYSEAGVKQLGQLAQVDTDSFNSCIDNRVEKATVMAITQDAQNNGVQGTPYFVVNDTPIKGVPSFEILDAAISTKL